MKRAAALARKAEGWTSPNPLVGAIIVRGAKSVGHGYHAKAGLPHAERNALEKAGNAARGAVMYVTLEPCSHLGRTPPCVRAIIEAGIRRVVGGIVDPNPEVHGKGFAALRAAGIEVTTGVLAGTCGELILPHFVNSTKKRPLVHLKLALSADGRIAPASGPARWLTGLPARRFGHRLRRRYDAVLVGIGTVLKDDPGLDVRFGKTPASQPLPVILDSQARLPLSSKLVRQKPSGRDTVLICLENAPHRRTGALSRAGVDVYTVATDDSHVSLGETLAILWGRGVRSILIEGGATVAASFLKAGLVDRVSLIVSPMFLGEKAVPLLKDLGIGTLAEAIRGRWLAYRRIGKDMLLEFELVERV